MKKPDEKTLNLWLKDELDEAELNQVEAWMQEHGSDLEDEFKCDIGWSALRSDLIEAVPESKEPPYPEFFNSKIQQAITSHEEENSPAIEAVESREPSFLQKLRWMLIPASVAALAAFFIGQQFHTKVPDATGGDAVAQYNTIYTPDKGVVAELNNSANATEIVLEGLTPIDDNLDIASFHSNESEAKPSYWVTTSMIPYDNFIY